MSLWGLIGTVALLALLAATQVALPEPVAAAPSSTLNFQARLESAAGAIAPDGNYDVEFKLYDASSSSGSSQGSCTGDAHCLWTEDYTYNSGAGATDVRLRVVNGYLTVNLGSITAFPGTINWNQQLYLTMNIGGTASSGAITWDGEMSPRIQLTAVPYAFQAGALSATSGGNIGKLSFGTISANDSITLPDASGTVCLQSSSACGFVLGSGTAFLQGGNSFGAQGVLGTNDSNSLAIRTNSTNKLVIDTSGNLQLQQASTFNIASAAGGSQLTVQAGANSTAAGTGGALLLQGGAPGTTGSSGSVIVKANTNDSTTAFQVQNAAGVALLTADTTNTAVKVGGGLLVYQTTACSYSNFVNSLLGLTPTGYWKLEDTSGSTAADSSGNGDTGTISATGVTLNQTPGPFSCATSHPYMAFTGASSGGITTATSFNNPQSFTLLALFKTTGAGPLITFTDNGVNNDRHLYVGTDGKLDFFMWNGAAQRLSSPASVTDGAWHLAAATLNNTGMYLYLDGVLVASNTQINAASYIGHWDIGFEWAATGGTDTVQYFTGSIAQAAVVGNVGAGTIATLAGEAGLYSSSIGYLGVNTLTPQYPLDVVGDINTSTQYRIAGTVVCTSSGCTPAAGSNNYVQLQGSTPGTAQTGYFNISGTGIAATLQASTFDTASAGALTVGNSHASSIGLGNTSSNIATTINGTALVKPTSGHDSTTAFQVQNAAGTTTLLNANTTNLKVTVAGDIVNTFSSGLGLTQVSATTTYATNPLWVAVQGKYAYVAEQGGTAALEILDITNPAAPARVGTLALAKSTPQQIQVQGHYVYIAERGTSNAGALEIVDVSNPHTPTSVTIVPVANGGPYGVYVSGRDAYLVDNATNDLAIIDISNPLVPTLVSDTAVNTSPRKVYVAGNYAYVVSWGGTSELQVINISNPASPSIVGTMTTNNQGDDISVQGRYAYITEYNAGTPQLEVVDISNPASPSVVAGPFANTYEYANVVSGRYLFTDGFNFDNSIDVLDVANPASPAVLQTYTTGLSQPAGMALAGRYLFVANETANNLLILDLSGLETTAATIHSLEAGNLTVDTNSYFGGDASVQGGLTVGGTTQLDGNLGVYGTAAFASHVNSTTAFQIQNASGVAVLTVDTSNSLLTIGGGLATQVVAKSANYTMTKGDWGILATGGASGVTVTLPSAATTGQIVWIKKVDSGAGAVTVARAGTDTIEGATSVTLASQYNGIYLIAGGSGVWYRIP